MLAHSLEKRSFDRLIIAAPPTALGDLRAAIPTAVSATVSGEVAKDLQDAQRRQVGQRNGRNGNVTEYRPLLRTHRQHRRQQLARCIGLIQQVIRQSNLERLVHTEDQLSAAQAVESQVLVEVVVELNGREAPSMRI